MVAERILDVPVLETVEQSVKLPNNVPQDRIRQRKQDMEELARFFKVSFLDRVQQSSAEQTIETPDITLGEKIVDGPVTQTQQVVNTRVQHVVPLLQIVKKTVEVLEVPLLQFNDKVVDIPVVVVAQVPQVHVVMKTAEIPQLQVKVVDVPVVLVVPVPQVRIVKKTVEDSQLQIVEKIIEIPEVLTVQGVPVSADLRALEEEEFDRKTKHQALVKLKIEKIMVLVGT